MIKKDYTRCWKAADRRELHLIRLWEETALKQRLLGALLIIFIFTLLYILMVLNLLKHIESIWKPALLYLIILAGVSFVWGAIIYEDEKKLWSGRFYTRIVTCIGHTETNTRYNTSYSLDILGEEGKILEKVEVSAAVLKAAKHQDKLLAATHNPEELRPHILVPLSKPSRSCFWYM